MKMDLALNNLQSLICHKTQTNVCKKKFHKYKYIRSMNVIPQPEDFN